MIIYRELLKKYIEYVGMQEGTDFIYENYKHMQSYFTEDEWKELMKLSEETEQIIR
jgi:hypothetical protein